MIPRADFSTVTAAQVQAHVTGSEGCFIIDNVFSPATCSLIQSDFATLTALDQPNRLLRADPDGSFRLLRARRGGNVHTSSYDGGPLSSIMHVLLSNVYLDSCLFSMVNTGSQGMNMHRDHDMPLVRTDPPMCIIAVVNLNDTDDTAGPTQVLLGTHLLEMDVKSAPLATFTSSAGSVMLMHGRLVHGASPNTSTEQRINLVSSYVSYLTTVDADLQPIT